MMFQLSPVGALGLRRRVTFLAGGFVCILALQACSSGTSSRPAAGGTSATPTQQAAHDPAMEQFVDSVLAKLTLEEKLGQLAHLPWTRHTNRSASARRWRGGDSGGPRRVVSPMCTAPRIRVRCNASPSSSRGRASPCFSPRT